MNLNHFLLMKQEIGLIVLFLLLFLYDTFFSQKGKKYFQQIAILLFIILMIYDFFLQLKGELFEGIYINSPLTIWMKNILNISTLFVFLQSHQWLSSKERYNKQGEFYSMILVSLLGMYIMISSRNFMMLYIGMEMASLPLACLVAFNENKKSAEASVKYILISAFSSGIMLFGLSFLYGSFGTFYFSEIIITTSSTTWLTILGFVFFLGGMGFKLSLVPFHLWTADVYEGAPTTITAYLSVATKCATAFALIFVLFNVFGPIKIIWQSILYVLSIITITIGNLCAIQQKDIKRFFAFSSISQAGYILLGIVTGTSQGMASMIYFLLTYLFANFASFGVISTIEDYTKHNVKIKTFNELYKLNPLLAFIMMISVFSLAGIPPLGGFFGKFFLFMSLSAQGLWILFFIAVLNTIISLYYYLLIIKAIFIKNSNEELIVNNLFIDKYNRTSLMICMIGTLIVGIISCIYEQINNLSFGIC